MIINSELAKYGERFIDIYDGREIGSKNVCCISISECIVGSNAGIFLSISGATIWIL